MRLKLILGATLGALLLTGTITFAGDVQQSTQVAVASQSPAPANESASAAKVVWYSDPIVVVLAMFALFAAIDIAIMIAKNNHHHNRHALR
ncbi:MAG: hypothetical protein ACRENH_14240 [Gemmatimonadaceae bacterium]